MEILNEGTGLCPVGQRLPLGASMRAKPGLIEAVEVEVEVEGGWRCGGGSGGGGSGGGWRGAVSLNQYSPTDLPH